MVPADYEQAKQAAAERQAEIEALNKKIRDLEAASVAEAGGSDVDRVWIKVSMLVESSTRFLKNAVHTLATDPDLPYDAEPPEAMWDHVAEIKATLQYFVEQLYREEAA